MSCGTAKKIELHACGDSPVHRLDARVKIIFLLTYSLVIVSFPVHEIPSLVPFFIFPVIFAIMGRVPLSLISKMLLLTAPFIISLVVLNPLLDTSTVALPVYGVTVSAGWLSLFSVLTRTVLTVSMVVIFTASTPLPSIVNGLSALNVPEVLVTQIHLICRYIFLLADESERMSHAWNLRCPHRRIPDIKTASKMISSLIITCYERAERVYFSMKARGFTGRMPTRTKIRMSSADFTFLIGGIAFCIIARFVPLTYWAGHFTMELLK